MGKKRPQPIAAHQRAGSKLSKSERKRLKKTGVASKAGGGHGDGGSNGSYKSKDNASCADQKTLRWLIHPVSIQMFFDKHFEKDPLHVRTAKRSPADNVPAFPGRPITKADTSDPEMPRDIHRFSHIFSRAHFSEAIRQEGLRWGAHFKASRYDGDMKHDMTPVQQDVPANPRDVWRLYDEGCSLQVFQPQQYSGPLWRIVEGMERSFGCLVGVNAYITPPNSQALAPHHDDVDVFIIQVEGRKRWKLYEPIDGKDLPREYSPDLDSADLGPPIATLTLEPGDFLYFPRGVVHQAVTSADPSVHLTVSTYQKHAWFDFVSTAFDSALQLAFKKCRGLREGLPPDMLNYMGAGHLTNATLANRQQEFGRRFEDLVAKVLDCVDLHRAADETSLDFTFNRIPPPPAEVPDPINQTAQVATAEACSPSVTTLHNVEESRRPLVPDLGQKVRLRNPGHMRMVMEQDEEGEPVVEVYHSLRNSRKHHMNNPDAVDENEPDLTMLEGNVSEDERGDESDSDDGDEDVKDDDEDVKHDDEEVDEDEDDEDDNDEANLGETNAPPCLSFPISYGPAMCELFSSYPNLTAINSLPLDTPTDKLAMIHGLLSENLVEIF